MSTTQELKELLDRAVQSIEVRRRGQLATRYSVESYRQLLQAVRQRYVPELKFEVAQCDIDIQDQTARDDLLGFLRVELREYIHDDRIQTAIIDIYGGLSSGFKIDELAKKLLQLVVALGSSKTAALFMNSLERSECEFQALTLLEGITVETPLELYDGIRLISLSQNSAELPGFLPAMFRPGRAERFLGATLIVEDGVVSPRYMNPQEYLAVADLKGNTPFRSVHKSTDMPNFNTVEFANALSMVIRARVFPYSSWRFVSENEIANIWENR